MLFAGKRPPGGAFAVSEGVPESALKTRIASPAFAKRSAGFFSSIFKTASARAFGTPGTRSRGEGAGV
jgi:hypothetical protein